MIRKELFKNINDPCQKFGSSRYAQFRNFKNPRNQGVSRFQSGEELVNSVGK